MNLVTFGDSWPAGGELKPEEHAFGSILGDLLQVEQFKNYGRGGTSAEHMILQLKRYIEDHQPIKDTIAIFFITSPSRALYIDDEGHESTIYPSMNDNNNERHHHYFKYLHTHPLEHFRLQTTILSLQRMSSENNIRDFYIVGWSKLEFDYPGIDKSKIYREGQINCADLFNVVGDLEMALKVPNKYIWPKNCHPNQEGHRLIAETLYHWLKEEHCV